MITRLKNYNTQVDRIKKSKSINTHTKLANIVHKLEFPLKYVLVLNIIKMSNAIPFI